jgi:hypothetical protein
MQDLHLYYNFAEPDTVEGFGELLCKKSSPAISQQCSLKRL